MNAAREALDLPGVTDPGPPAGVEVGLSGIAAWQTPSNRFYRIDTSLSPPAISPADWSVRIHGMVDREITLTYADLVQAAAQRDLDDAQLRLQPRRRRPDQQRLVERYVHLKDLLEEAGVQPGADAVKQTSDDGWTCGTPLSAMLDGRGAMLAYAMNGEPLPIEHGFPVRTLVPGLYGYVSACKWVRDIEVTTFDSFSAYWTDRGWSVRGRSSSRHGSTCPATATTCRPARCGSAVSPGSRTPGSRRCRCSSTAAAGSRPRSPART